MTGKQRRYLRALGHHLEPVVQLGKQGITEAVFAAADEALATHELIKVRRNNDCPVTREEIAAALALRLSAQVVQELGHTVLLYRRHPSEPKIDLPK